MVGLIGKKLGHTSVYDAHGVLRAVTVVVAGPNRVLQIRTLEKDGYSAVQLGFGSQKIQRLTRPQLGHLVKQGVLDSKEAEKSRQKADEKPVLNGVARIREFRNFTKEVKTGEMLGVNVFAPGDFVDCIGITKGRGFEGVVKRHAFRGGDSTHGAKGWHRRSGAIGCRLFPGTVRRGLPMPGHMGQVRRTVQNLQVVQVLEADNVLLISGSIPGAEGDYVIIRESKKRPKGWAPKPPPQSGKKKGAAKAEAKPAAAPAAAPAKK